MPKVDKRTRASNISGIRSDKKHPYNGRPTRQSNLKNFFGRSLSQLNSMRPSRLFSFLKSIRPPRLFSFLKPLFNYKLSLFSFFKPRFNHEKSRKSQFGNTGRTSSTEPIKKDTPKTSDSLPEYIHICIISTMKKMGYRHTEEGMCYGIAWTALLACVRNAGQAYMKRMLYLKKMKSPPLPGTDDTHKIYPFFDTVTLSMTNYTNMDGYEKGIGYPGRQEIDFPGQVIGSHKPDDNEAYQVPVVKHTFVADCTPERLIQFLQQTRENNPGISFGLMIHHTDHAISIGFDGNKWLAADHNNHYYTETTNLLHSFFLKQSDRYRDGKMTALIDVVTAGPALDINRDAIVLDERKSVSVPIALHLALQHGDVNVTNNCIKVIGEEAHTPEKLLELLTCKKAINTPGLCIALYNGHSGTITVFIQESAAAIDALPLPPEQKAKLLYELFACKDDDGTPGLCMALYNGHPGAITVFIQEIVAAIDALPLSAEQKVKWLYRLLACKSYYRTPGFFMALKKGHSEAIRAFIQAIATAIDALPLSAEQKAKHLYELFACKDAHGTPGFFKTLEEGHAEAIRAFIQAIATAIDALPLSPEQKAKWLYKLLDCESYYETRGFFKTLEKGHSNAIIAFIQEIAAVIDALPLPAEQKANWLYKLLASEKYGTPGFFMVLENGHSEAITAFIQTVTTAIAALPLSAEQKAKLLYKLLACKDYCGTPGFLLTLEKGHSDATTAFIKACAAAINTFELPEEEKAKWLYELFACEDDYGKRGFSIALQNGNSAVINAFTEGIDQLPLSAEQKIALKNPVPFGKN